MYWLLHIAKVSFVQFNSRFEGFTAIIAELTWNKLIIAIKKQLILKNLLANSN